MTSSPAELAFLRIDPIRSVTEMRREIAKLDSPLREEVILFGLSRSMHQFTWSHFANRFAVPEAQWPAEPKGLRAYWFGSKAEAV